MLDSSIHATPAALARDPDNADWTNSSHADNDAGRRNYRHVHDRLERPRCDNRTSGAVFTELGMQTMRLNDAVIADDRQLAWQAWLLLDTDRQSGSKLADRATVSTIAGDRRAAVIPLCARC